MPPLAILLAIAGVIPVIGCGLGALGRGGFADQLLLALVGYGAVMLSFVGGMQWGVALQPAAAAAAQRWRLILAVLPPLLGWAALLVRLALPNWIALALLAAGFIGTMIVEQQAMQRGLPMPSGYLWLRWGLTVVTAAMLITVLTVRLLGLTVTF